MAVVLFDGNTHKSLLPLTYTRAVADIRVGIWTMRERWQYFTGNKIFVETEEYLSPLYEQVPSGNNLYIDASVIPDLTLAEKILSIHENDVLYDGQGNLIAVKGFGSSISEVAQGKRIYIEAIPKRIKYPWHIFQLNAEVLPADFALLTNGQTSAPISSTNQVIGGNNIFIEEGAVVEFVMLNASEGPIYIGKNSLVMEGSLIRGPFALGEHAVIKMGSKIYGASTVGPFCVAGGEIKNAVMHSYSNKAHDGYLGDSVIGSWCNLGAGTSNSNVKNTATEIKMPDQANDSWVDVGQKCGVIMGDYTRTAINTSINTGSSIGVSCNVFGDGLAARSIPSFSWGSEKNVRYSFEKALTDIGNWKKFKNERLTNAEADVLKYIFDNFL